MSTYAAQGLEGVVAASTRLSLVDGAAGRLTVAGYPVEEIAPRLHFEEMVHLLWHGRLPDAGELQALQAELAARRALPHAATAVLQEAARTAAPAMDALRMAVATLSLTSPGSPEDDACTLVAAFPAIVGGYWRLRQGLEPLPPREHLSHAEHCLEQMFGGGVGPARARGLETYLNTVCDHGLNASTFAARVDRVDADGSGVCHHRCRRRTQGPIARRGSGAGARHGVRDSRAGSCGGGHSRPPQPGRAVDGLRPLRVSRPRSAGGCPRRGSRAVLRRRGGSQALWTGQTCRDGGPSRPRRAQAGPADRHECRVLYRAPAPRARHPEGIVHGDVCDWSRPRMDRPLPGAASRWTVRFDREARYIGPVGLRLEGANARAS